MQLWRIGRKESVLRRRLERGIRRFLAGTARRIAGTAHRVAYRSSAFKESGMCDPRSECGPQTESQHGQSTTSPSCLHARTSQLNSRESRGPGRWPTPPPRFGPASEHWPLRAPTGNRLCHHLIHFFVSSWYPDYNQALDCYVCTTTSREIK